MTDTFIPYAELAPEQRAQVDSPRRLDRTMAASRGYGLDKLAHDPEFQVREEVANQGFALDALSEDEHRLVRAAVAAQGYAPARFASDPAWECRYAVAKQGLFAEALASDEDPYVSKAATEAIQSQRAERQPASIPRRTPCHRTPAAQEELSRSQARTAATFAPSTRKQGIVRTS